LENIHVRCKYRHGLSNKKGISKKTSKFIENEWFQNKVFSDIKFRLFYKYQTLINILKKMQISLFFTAFIA